MYKCTKNVQISIHHTTNNYSLVAVDILQLLAEKGVQFRFKTTAKEFVGENGKLKRVLLTDETVLPAELCVVGIGKVFVYDVFFALYS